MCDMKKGYFNKLSHSLRSALEAARMAGVSAKRSASVPDRVDSYSPQRLYNYWTREIL